MKTYEPRGRGGCEEREGREGREEGGISLIERVVPGLLGGLSPGLRVGGILRVRL